MSLYDNYQLSNSSQVPQYVGSAIPEIAADYQQAQQTYDNTAATDQATQDMVNQIPHLDKDKQTWIDQLNQSQQEHKDNIEKGDYENMYGKVQAQARNAALKAQPIAAQHAAAVKYREELGSKDLGLDANTQEDLYAKAMDEYKGVQVDAQGKPVAGTTFSPGTAAKAVDRNELIRQSLSILTPYKDSTITKRDDGWWATDKMGKSERIEDPTVQNAWQSARANNKDWLAYDKQDLDIANWKSNRGINVQNAPTILNHVLANIPDSYRVPVQDPRKTITDVKGNIIPNPSYGQLVITNQPNTAKAELQMGLKQGIAPDQLLKSYNAYTNQKNQYDNQRNYAVSKEFGQNESETGSKPGELWLYTQKKKLDNLDDAPYIVQGPDTKLTDAETDPNKLTETNTNLNNSITSLQADAAMYQKQLDGTQDPNLRAQTQANLGNTLQRIQNMQGQVQKSNELLNYSKNRTALNMGYKNGYPEFVTAIGSKLAPVISKEFPKGIAGLSAKEISDAVADGRVNTSSNSTGMFSGGFSQVGAGPGTTIDGNTTTTIRTRDGRIVTIPQEDNLKLNGILTDDKAKVNDQMSNFQKTFATNHKANVQNYSTKSEVISLGEKDAKDITRTLKGATGGIEFSEPGQLDNLKEKDRPTDYRIVAMTPEGIDNGVIFKAEGLDEKGNPTGKVYDAKTTDTNIGEEQAKKWMNTDSPAAQLAASMLQPNSGYRNLSKLNVGQEYPLGKMELSKGNISDIKIRPTRVGDNSIVYTLYDAKGNILRSEVSAAKAGKWIDIHRQQSGQ